MIFFEYTNYEDFKEVYQDITKESDDAVKTILEGKNKNYPKERRPLLMKFRYLIAEKQFNENIRSSKENIAGIPGLGGLLRSYLKFLYYTENPQIPYPAKYKNVNSMIDDNGSSQKYWVLQCGPNRKFHDDFLVNNLIAVGWDYLGDFTEYETRDDITETIKEYESLNHEPWMYSLAVWQFTNVMKDGDVVYAAKGANKIIGKGIVKSDYIHKSERTEEKNIREVEWLELPEEEYRLNSNITAKTLTDFTKYPKTVEHIETLIEAGQTAADQSIIDEFTEWLSKEKDDSGTLITDDIIQNRVNAILEYEKESGKQIFNNNDIENIKEIRDNVSIQSEESHLKLKKSLDSFIRYLRLKPTEVTGNEPYDDNNFLQEVFLDDHELSRLRSLLKNKKNLILKGAPGVRKTFVADRLAYTIMGEVDQSRIHFIQFHQSYSYEEFIEGFRPAEDGNGFTLKSGPFLEFCERASQDDRPYFFIIDEINRGNLSRILGELMMLIESDKRGQEINLLYSNKPFSVPGNVYIIGTMNTADRSLSMMDYALRRRFSFFDLKPAFDKHSFNEFIKEYENTELVLRFLDQLRHLNRRIEQSFGAGFKIGHSYFISSAMRENTKDTLIEILEYEITPQLEEFWFDDLETVEFERNNLRSVLDES